MVLLTLLLTTTALAIPLTSPQSRPPLATRSTAVGTGSHSGFFYSFWHDGGGSVSYTNLDSGSYSVRWTNCSNFVAGKGWSPGVEDRNITFSSEFKPQGNGYLSVYGWMSDPIVEYYVVENWGTFNPTGMFGGTGKRIEVDGGWYTVGVYRRIPMGLGQPIITQVYSVRDAADRRSSGTVTLKKHFEVWKGLSGVRFGSMDYQIVGVEGYMSSGVADVTVFE